PRVIERLDGFPVSMEYPGDDARLLALDGRRVLTLLLQDAPKRRRHREHATLTILRLARLQPQPAAAEVDVRPLPRQQLRPHAPAGLVCDIGQWLHLRRQVRAHRLELLWLEKTLPRVVLA